MSKILVMANGGGNILDYLKKQINEILNKPTEEEDSPYHIRNYFQIPL